MQSLNTNFTRKSYDVARSYRDTGKEIEVTEVFALPYDVATAHCERMDKAKDSLAKPQPADPAIVAEVEKDAAALDAALPA